MPSQPTVCIVESLNFLEERTHREGEIISRTLQLSNKPTAYVYIRTVEELRAVAQEFGGSDHRYLHLSFHGLVHKKKMVGLALSAGEILNEDLVNLLGPHLSGRRLFLSSCLAARSDLATTLLERSQCRSVLAPVSNIGFDDAAVLPSITLCSRDSRTQCRMRALRKRCASARAWSTSASVSSTRRRRRAGKRLSRSQSDRSNPLGSPSEGIDALGGRDRIEVNSGKFQFPPKRCLSSG